uniref:F-box domain-containing protein n=1 Tax=Mycena chlorophos TaxID=658473 RepID=A0ABQ0M499_MYCCL|nr:predicted protein [Mycena chlorophos]
MTPVRVAVVTGAAQGIGRAIALRLAEDGLNVAVADLPHKLDMLDAVVDEINGLGKEACAICVDVTDEEQVAAMVQKAVETFGRLDVMVANAGIVQLPAGSITDADLTSWESVWRVNLRGVVLSYKYAARQMIKQGQGGRIIGASSVAAFKATPGFGGYCISKAGVRSLTQCAALELREHRITVNAYAPGLIDTPMLAAAMDGMPVDENENEASKTQQPTVRIGQPKDVAAMVSFFASEGAHFVTDNSASVWIPTARNLKLQNLSSLDSDFLVKPPFIVSAVRGAFAIHFDSWRPTRPMVNPATLKPPPHSYPVQALSMRSHTLVYKGSDLVDNAFCPICHGRFVHRKSRNQHMGLPGCLKAAAANGLPVPETAADVVELKRQFATRLLGRLADSWFRLWPSQRRKFGAEKTTTRGRVHVDDAEPGQHARSDIGRGIVRPPSVRVLDHRFPPLRRVEGPRSRSRSAFSSSQTQASDWTRTASFSAVSSSTNAAFQHQPEQLGPPSYWAADSEFLPLAVPPTRLYSASDSSPRAFVQGQSALERPVFDYSTQVPVAAIGASGAQGYGSSSLAGALGDFESGSTPSNAPAASMHGPSEPPLAEEEEESTSTLSMDETLAMLFDSFISPIPADAEEIQALDIDAVGSCSQLASSCSLRVASESKVGVQTLQLLPRADERTGPPRMSIMSSVMADDRARLPSLDAEIGKLEHSLSILHDERKAIQGRLDAFVYPVLTLPNEITSEIFMQYIPPYPARPPILGDGSPTKLGQICRHWRTIAHGMPALWRAIQPFEFNGRGDHIRAHHRLEVMRTWLQRSCALPLSIKVHNYDDRQHTVAGATLSEILLHSSRWEHVDFNLLKMYGLTTGNHRLEGDMPKLRQLGLNACYLGIDHQEFSRLVSLPWAQLTRIYLNDFLPDVISGILTSAPALVAARISFRVQSNSGPQDNLRLDSIIRLDRLETFVVESPGFRWVASEYVTAIRQLLHEIRAPGLRRLHIHESMVADPSRAESLVALLKSLDCRLEQLRVVYAEELYEDYRRLLPERLRLEVSAPALELEDLEDDWGPWRVLSLLPRRSSARQVQPMPPPTVGDAWLTGRRFGIVVDAGSSGSRVQIYSWRDPRTLDVRKGSPLATTLPKVEKGTRDGENWMFKVEPGISSFADKPEDIANHLRPLLAHARELIPPSLQHETPLFLLATAGMRLLTPEKQAALLQQTCNFLVHHSDFKIDAPSKAGPCGSSIRIITGEEEGLFGWIAVNYLMDGFQADQTTYGFLDMGGASTQIAFEPQSENVDDEMDLIEVRLRLLGGEEINHKVFVTTWLGYGTNQARERYVGKAITEHEKGRGENGDDVVHDPCLPADLELTEHPVHLGPTNEHAKKTHRLLGTGSFEQCMRKTASLLNNNSPCPDSPCLMNGVHVPTIDFSVSHFIGVSEYWYSSEHVFGLGGPYDFVQYERAASQFCSRTWSDIIGEHERSQHVHVGDGEVEKDGKIVEVGNWSDKVEVSRLQMQCFKAAWIANVLHDGIGMPRIIDNGGNNTTDGEKVAAQAENKGLGRPTFQSVDTVGDIAISWTLGKMVLEASKEVTPLVKTAPPLADPLDEPANSDSPIKPIRPPRIWEIVEDRLEDHLPASLTREELGFSPVMMLLYLLMLVAFFLIAIPLLKRLRAVGLRVLAGRERRSVLLEEGKGQTVNGGWGSSSRWLRRLSSMFMQGSTTTTTISQRPTNIYLPPHSDNNSPDSPLRSSTLPPPAIGFSSTTSRSPSPGPAFIEVEEVGAEYPLSGVLSRSRNSSSKNLAAMAGSAKPRSRVASGNGPSYY